MEKVVVAGAGFGGLQAALILGRKGYNVEVIDKSIYHVYKPGLIDLVRNRCSPEDLKLDLEKFFEDTSIDFFQDEIKQINPENNFIEGIEQRYNYDYLVLALGGEPVRPSSFEQVLTPYTIEEASELSEISDNAAVIGGGYVGLEFAGELNQKGIKTTVFDLNTRPLTGFPLKVSEKALDTIVDLGVKFRGGKKITRVEENTVQFEESEEEFEQVVSALGVKTNNLIMEMFDGPIETNQGLCSVNYGNIFALGKCNNRQKEDHAHNSISEAHLIVRNISKKDYEELEKLSKPRWGDLISLGSTALFVRNDLILENRLFRFAKDMIRKTYFVNLKRQKWMLKNLM